MDNGDIRSAKNQDGCGDPGEAPGNERAANGRAVFLTTNKLAPKRAQKYWPKGQIWSWYQRPSSDCLGDGLFPLALRLQDQLHHFSDRPFSAPGHGGVMCGAFRLDRSVSHSDGKAGAL